MKTLYNHKCRSSLPGLRTLDPPLGPPHLHLPHVFVSSLKPINSTLSLLTNGSAQQGQGQLGWGLDGLGLMALELPEWKLLEHVLNGQVLDLSPYSH